MKSKYIASLVTFISVLFFMVSFAGAYSVTLDGVDNAGWYDGSLDQSYLRLLDESNKVRWSHYGSSLPGSLPWSDFTGLVTDLADGWIGADPSGTELGKYTIQSGGNVFGSSPASPLYTSLSLSGGRYEISLDPSSRAYNLEGYDNKPIYLGGNMWNAYVQMWTSEPVSQNLAFGDGGTTFIDEGAAIAHHLNPSNNISLYLAGDADLFFYINDNNSLDNIGSVTLNIQASPVPIPATFPLLCTGLIALSAGRIFRKRKALEAAL